ncbi:hypothetical protein ACFL6C_12580 [Myxococcota bacterium]
MGRPAKTKTTPYDLTGRIAFRASGLLMGLAEKWAKIYQKHEGQAMTPDLLARRLLLHTLRDLDRKLDQGKIDLEDPDLRLPG